MAVDAPPDPDRRAGNGATEPTSTDALPAPDGAMLGGQYILSPKNPVAAFTTKVTVAVEASDRRSTIDQIVALICSPDVVPRVDVMAALRGWSKPGAMMLKDFGPLDWPDGKQRLVAIYTAPRGGRVSLSTPMPAWQIIEALFRPAVDALTELHARAVTHRAIRPDNLYIREPGLPALALGPCVATPPGFDQPEVYEPLETAMADPSGRGDGTARHDLFALGMSAVALLLGREPGAGVDRDELMIRRIELGSLAAVVDPASLPPEIVDPLRGLLTDVPSERWLLKDLSTWLRGGRVDPPRIQTTQVAAKPFTIAGKAVRSTRSLAYMIGRAPDEAAKLLRGDELRGWMRNELGDNAGAQLLDMAVQERDPESGGFDSDVLLAARAVAALDPLGPVRYCGLAVDPLGLGPFLFDASRHKEKTEIAISMVDQGLPQKLLDRRPTDRRRATRQAINFERLRRWITSPQPAEGLDRCLYDLNTYLPCLSPMTDGKWIVNGRGLVRALDKRALGSANAELKLDASAAAFLAARLEIDGHTLLALMKPDAVEEDVLLDAIRLFADEQAALGGPPLPGIARWCGKLAQRIAESIHHRPTRKELLDKIEAALPDGNITALYKALAIDGLKTSDNAGFNGAKSAWERLESEVYGIEREAERLRLHAWRRGRDNVPVASGAGSMLAFLATLFMDAIR
jgi:eukaryotic-like serine/threonine-protein kinase